MKLDLAKIILKKMMKKTQQNPQLINKWKQRKETEKLLTKK